MFSVYFCDGGWRKTLPDAVFVPSVELYCYNKLFYSLFRLVEFHFRGVFIVQSERSLVAASGELGVTGCYWVEIR